VKLLPRQAPCLRLLTKHPCAFISAQMTGAGAEALSNTNAATKNPTTENGAKSENAMSSTASNPEKSAQGALSLRILPRRTML